MYNAGALVEAAVHHYLATGKMSLLRVAVRFANHMCEVMGPPPRKNIVPGHPLPEEALVKLYRLFRDDPELKERVGEPVDERRYLALAEFWIESRGNNVGDPTGSARASSSARRTSAARPTATAARPGAPTPRTTSRCSRCGRSKGTPCGPRSSARG